VAVSGLILLVAGFAIYMVGVPAPHIPIEEIPRLWHLDSEEYIRSLAVPTGWSWLKLAGRADLISFATVVLQAGSSVICLAVVLPVFMKERDLPYLLIVAAQIVVLLVAASPIGLAAPEM
jgi:hypothetical protein